MTQPLDENVKDNKAQIRIHTKKQTNKETIGLISKKQQQQQLRWCITLFVSFLCPFYTTLMWKCLILRFFKHVASLGIWHFNKLWTKLFHDSLLHLIDLWSSNTDWWITRIRAVMTVHFTLWVISHYLCLRIQPSLLRRSSSFTIQSYLYLSNCE